MIKNFSLDGWTCFSDRRNSKSYVSNDKKWMVKFFSEFTNSNLETLEKEKEISEKALKIGVKTPKVGDIVELSDGQHGLIYEYIEGKKSIARASGEDPEHIEEYMKRFARIAKQVHSKVCDVHDFVSREQIVREEIEKRDILNESQKQKAYRLLDTIEKKNTCLHGDFQHGNFIITKTDEYAIDLGGIAYGNPIYDVACFYFFLYFFPKNIPEMLFHTEEKYFDALWRNFVKYYYEVSEEKEIDKISLDMRKYALVCFFGMLRIVEPGDEIKMIMDEHFDKEFKDF